MFCIHKSTSPHGLRFRPPSPGAVALSAAAQQLRGGGAPGLGGGAAEEDAAELGAVEKPGENMGNVGKTWEKRRKI